MALPVNRIVIRVDPSTVERLYSDAGIGIRENALINNIIVGTQLMSNPHVTR